jgi:hypothetical protein
VNSDWIPLTLYSESQDFDGSICCPTGLRLSDYLNCGPGNQYNKRRHYLEFIEDTKFALDSKTEEQSKSYLNREALELVAVLDADLARGLGASSSSKVYPFVNKSKICVTVRLAKLMITGNVHCSDGQSILDVLQQDTNFLPMTDVTISDNKDGRRSIKPFVLVSKEKILALQEEVSLHH